MEGVIMKTNFQDAINEIKEIADTSAMEAFLAVRIERIDGKLVPTVTEILPEGTTHEQRNAFSIHMWAIADLIRNVMHPPVSKQSGE
jgi:hypothetical protein